jgi:hypothetical protein
MALTPSGSRRHGVRKLGRDDYEISWSVYRKHGRTLFGTRYARFVDEKGAKRFAKKWGLEVPE